MPTLARAPSRLPERVLPVLPLLLALALLGGCGTFRSTVASLVSPILRIAAPSADPDDDCTEQPHLVPAPRALARVRIGTWNMYYVGPSDERPEETRDPRELAAYIRASGVSVLALQEIGSDPRSADPRNPLLDAVFAELRRDGRDWHYVLFGTDEDPEEFTGLAWDRRVFTQSEAPRVLDLGGIAPGPIPGLPSPGGERLFKRKPFVVKLSAGRGYTDLVFVVVHLRARVESFFFFLEDATAQREEEAELLARSVVNLRRRMGDGDVVVLGDFNTELATEAVTDALLERGWRDLNCEDLGTHVLTGMALDRIVVPADQPEFALQPNFAVVDPAEIGVFDFRSRLSDHRMVVCDVLIAADDD